MALRFAGGASQGTTPKTYYLGGTTNWIGDRTFAPSIYRIENLYFADVVTPLRAVRYYELSGNRYAVANWEFRFPLIQYFAMRFPLPIVLGNIMGVTFFDIGSAWKGDEFRGSVKIDGNYRLQDIRSAFGFGARITTGPSIR